LVARVWPLAAVRALVYRELARLSSPVAAARLFARVRPLTAVRALGAVRWPACVAWYSHPGSSHACDRSPSTRWRLDGSSSPRDERAAPGEDDGSASVSASLAPPTSVQYSDVPSPCAHPRGYAGVWAAPPAA
ncbi:hypothetical protein T492DRAFT_481780, partial [Pavlovales sp. CCMP2436]